MPAHPQFQLLLPEIFGFKGGMQVYSAFFLQALQKLHPAAGYEVFLRRDRADSPNLRTLEFLPQTRFHYLGEPIYEANRWRRRWHYASGSARMLGQATLKRPELVVATELSTYAVTLDWLNRFTGIPYWVVVHGWEAWDIQNPAYRTALRHAQRVVAVSEYTRQRVLAGGYLDPAQVVLLPNTFDADAFPIRPKPDYLLQRYGLAPHQPVILTVCRLAKSDKYKGYDQILKALPQIRQQIPDVRYILAGKGNDRARLEKLIHQLDLQDLVILPGFIPESELADHYNLCDVFAMPSKGEGFGIVYLEAMACGKPVLAGNQDGAVDPLVHGELGCLVDPDDTAAIAHHLTQILQGTYPNPLMYQPEQLRQQVIDRYGFSQFRQQLERLLQAV